MTIRPGEPWGSPDTAPTQTVWFPSDRDLGRALDAGVSGAVGICGGDLVSVTGQLGARSSVKISIDALVVRYANHTTGIAGSTHAVSWIRLGNWWSRGGMQVVSNTGLVEGREWFARSHPNDGLLDAASVAGEMPMRQRLLARRRVASGLPFSHRQIQSSRDTQFHWSGRPTDLVVDGERVARVTSLEVVVQPDALVVYVGSPSTAN